MLSNKQYSQFFLAIFNNFHFWKNFPQFFFFLYTNLKLFQKHHKFFSVVFKKNLHFFILSKNIYFLQFYAFPLFLLSKLTKKKSFISWAFFYNLINLKTPIWIRYLYFFLKKNKINIIINTLPKKYLNWLKYFRQKNFILTGPVEKESYINVFDFPFYLPKYFIKFYLFYILHYYFLYSKQKIYQYFYFFKRLNFILYNLRWKLL